MVYRSMEFKNIKNITDGVATMLIYSEIGGDGINGQYFADEMAWLQDNASTICVRINSGGGSIVDGYSIVTAMLNSEVPVHVYIDGLAASMAGIIAMCGEKTYMNDYGLFMMHNPSGGSPETLEYFKETLVAILTKRTGMNAEQISAMMDKETWMNAKECKSMNLIDEIIKTKKKVAAKALALNGKSENYAEVVNVFNKLINENKKQKMEQIINKLSLAEGSTEETIVNSITELQAQRDTLMENLETAAKEKIELEEKFKELENQIAEFNKAKEAEELAKKEAEKLRVEEMINHFVKEAKIKVEEKDKYINLATIDFETTKEMLERAGVKNSVKLADILTVVTAVNATPGRESWNMRDWEKKDPKGLLQMKNETPEIYNELYKATYLIK